MLTDKVLSDLNIDPADLAGYDHVHSDEEAEAMEALEIAALAKMGIPDPYGDRHSTEEKP